MSKTIRIGQGFDVHAFGDGDHLILGGVRVEFHRGMQAHSDGDVVLHALCDAILGALALGDIGQHFPPNDMRWKNADSGLFLDACLNMMRERNFECCNLDITVLAERPKIAPHALQIRTRIATAMQINLDAVSVKATTTERLGFTGREEGIAAMAVVLLQAQK